MSSLWKKCSKCHKKNYLLQCAKTSSVREEIRSQGKILSRNCVKGIYLNTVSQDEDSKSDDEKDETMIHVLNMFQSE